MAHSIKQVFVFLIFIITCLPSIGLLINSESFESCDKQNIHLPKADLFNKEMISHFEKYFKQKGSFRNTLNHLSAYYKFRLFKSSAKPDQVLIGNRGWLYYSSKSDKLIDSYAHQDLYTDAELKAKIIAWQKRKTRLKKKGINYYMAIWPNKPTIYPEHLPKKLAKLKRDTLSKTDQIINYCKINSSSITPLDIRGFLLDKKKNGKIYHQTDSHWNALGAYYAYQALMIHLDEEPYNLQDFDITWNDKATGGDLLGLLSLCNIQRLFETSPNLKLKSSLLKSPRQIEKKEPLERQSYYYNSQAKSTKKLLVFRDSYFSALIPYVALHYEITYCPWTYYDQKLVDTILPDIVLSANVERRL